MAGAIIHLKCVPPRSISTDFLPLQLDAAVAARTRGNGVRAGLQFSLRSPAAGYRVLVHRRDEQPELAGRHHVQLPDRAANVLVAMEPHVMRTSKRLRGYAPAVRQCYFEAERPLRFYRAYAQRNCELECVANGTLRRCGCVLFDMPSE